MRNETTTLETIDGADVRRVCCAADARLVPMFDAFEAINARIFGGSLPPHPLVIGLAPYGKCLEGSNAIAFLRPAVAVVAACAAAAPDVGNAGVHHLVKQHANAPVMSGGVRAAFPEVFAKQDEPRTVIERVGLERYHFARRRSARVDGKPRKATPDGFATLRMMSAFPNSMLSVDIQLQDYMPEWAR
jgi:hypothetical protein